MKRRDFLMGAAGIVPLALLPVLPAVGKSEIETVDRSYLWKEWRPYAKLQRTICEAARFHSFMTFKMNLALHRMGMGTWTQFWMDLRVIDDPRARELEGPKVLLYEWDHAQLIRFDGHCLYMTVDLKSLRNDPHRVGDEWEAYCPFEELVNA